MSGKKLVLLIVLVVLVFGFLGFNWYFFENSSEGQRTGVVSKCSIKGAFSKTHECEAFVGSVGSAPGSTAGAGLVSASVWSFTVKDDVWDAGVGATIEQAMDSGVSVKFDYIQPRCTAPWLTSSGYYVIKVTLRSLTQTPSSDSKHSVE